MAQFGTSQDVNFTGTPADGISAIAMNGNTSTPTNMVIAASWDNSLSCYELNYMGATVNGTRPIAQFKHEAPVLCCDVGGDGYTTFSAGADSHIYSWDPRAGPQSATKIGKHDNPVRCLKWIPELNCVATASWDKTLKVWDARTPMPALSLTLSERAYAMDIKDKMAVIGTADRNIRVYGDISLGQQQGNVIEYVSPMSYQTRCVSIFADKQGYAIGSIEGRVAIEYIDELPAKTNPQLKSTAAKSFIFKCHRDGNDIYGVNCIDFHMTNKFLTGGSDGSVVWWDKDARNRLAAKDWFKKGTSRPNPLPICAAKFTPNGQGMIVAASYDWSQGHSGSGQTGNTEIALKYHAVSAADISTRKGK
jgi:mRNA export factor